MTSLLDIGPLTEQVSVGGKSVTVHGVTPEGFFYIIEKFPDLRNILGGGKLDPAALIVTAPAAVAFALAVATTDRSLYSLAGWREAIDEAAKVAVNLPAHYQMELFQAALRLTFPDGIGPFMQAVERLATSINRVSGQTAQDTTSSKPLRSGFTTDSVGMRLGQVAQSANLPH
jgi:hypothetical protein